jgi:PD-(D/E)XK nuclease superfamily
MPPKTFSHTQLQSYRQCGKAYYFHYIEHLPAQASGNLVQGRAYHTALEYAYKYYLTYQQQPEVSEVLQVYSDDWDDNLRQKITYDIDGAIQMDAVNFGKKNAGQMKDAGAALVKMYYHGLYQRFYDKIAQVEVTKYANVTDDLWDIDVPVMGILDLIDLNEAIYDHKCTEKKYSAAQLATNTQSSFYGILMGAQSDFDFTIHQGIATQQLNIIQVPIHRTHDDLFWLSDVIMETWKDIQAGRFPANPFSFWCGPDKCSYWYACHRPKEF